MVLGLGSPPPANATLDEGRRLAVAWTLLLTRWRDSGGTPWIAAEALKPCSPPADRHQGRGRLARLKELADDTDRLNRPFNREQM